MDGKTIVKIGVTRTGSAAFTAAETFDVGVGMGSTAALNASDRRPFAFNGKIESVDVELK